MWCQCFIELFGNIEQLKNVSRNINDNHLNCPNISLNRMLHRETYEVLHIFYGNMSTQILDMR